MSTWRLMPPPMCASDVSRTNLPFLNLGYLNPRHFCRIFQTRITAWKLFTSWLSSSAGLGRLLTSKRKSWEYFFEVFSIPPHMLLSSESGQAMRNMRRVSTCLVWHSSVIILRLEPVYTMDHEVGSRRMVLFHGPTWWPIFHGLISLKKHHFTKPLGPSPWTMKSEDGPFPRSDLIAHLPWSDFLKNITLQSLWVPH